MTSNNNAYPNIAAMEFNIIRWLYAPPVISYDGKQTMFDQCPIKTGVGLICSLRERVLSPGLSIITFKDTIYSSNVIDCDINSGILVNTGINIDTSTIDPPTACELLRLDANISTKVPISFQFNNLVISHPRIDIMLDLHDILFRITAILLQSILAESNGNILNTVDQGLYILWPCIYQIALKSQFPDISKTLVSAHKVQHKTGDILGAAIDQLIHAVLQIHPCEWIHAILRSSITFLGSYVVHRVINSEHDHIISRISCSAEMCHERTVTELSQLYQIKQTHWPLGQALQQSDGPNRTETVIHALASGILPCPVDMNMKVKADMRCFMVRRIDKDKDPTVSNILMAVVGIRRAGSHDLDIVCFFPGNTEHTSLSIQSAATSVLQESIHDWCIDRQVTDIVVWYPKHSKLEKETYSAGWIHGWWKDNMRMTVIESQAFNHIVNDSEYHKDSSWPWFRIKVSDWM
jgi:hypothetical protein